MLLLNDGAGRFTTAPAGFLPTVDNHTLFLASGDLNGDGNQDVVAAGNFVDILVDKQHAVLTGAGDGTFSASRFGRGIGDAGKSALGVLISDVDGDGFLDAVLRVGSQPDLLHTRYYVNDGIGSFVDLTNQLPDNGIGYGVQSAGDVDGNGTIDLVAPRRTVLNTALGFINGNSLPTNLGLYATVRVTDVDSDGDLDFLTGQLTGPTIPKRRLFLNDGSGHYINQSLRLPQDEGAQAILALVDIDEDGNADIVYQSFTASTHPQLRFVLTNGNGLFARTEDPDAHMPPAGGVAAGDLNGDGNIDAFITGLNTGSTSHAQLGDGAGRFEPSPAGTQGPPAPTGSSVMLIDVESDGDLDAITGSYTDVCAAFTNDGSGVMTYEPSAFPGHQKTTYDIAGGDLDGDGDPDVVVANEQLQRLYRNDGSGAFTDNSSEFSGTIPLGGMSAVELADFDGDGDLDVLFGGGLNGLSASTLNPLLLNDGTGSFPTLSYWGGPVHTLSAGDFDVDGDIDFFGGHHTDGGRFYQNSGAGTFTIVGPVIDHSCLDSELIDVDGDGRKNDVLVSGADGLALFRRSAAGPAVLVDRLGRWAGRLAVVDVDEDGDEDVIAPVLGATSVFSNVQRHVAYRKRPRIGRPLTIDVLGNAGDPFILAVDLTRTKLHFPSLGILKLPPATLRLVSLGVLDAEGAASFSAVVPPLSAWVDLELYWQALVGQSPAFLTNLEVSKITDF